jgi:carboxyl-terminal processing protease
MNGTEQFDNENSETRTQPIQPEKKPSQLFLGIALAVLLATATFFSGFHIGTESRNEANIFSFFAKEEKQPDDAVDLGEFWHVWNLLEDKFVVSSTTDVVTNEERIQGAIFGLVRSYGDPYTSYLPPKDAEVFDENISGNFSGVGMEVGIRDDAITIIAPLPDTPAEIAGLIAGDVIVRIDGESTENMTIDEAVQRIRGEEGTDVLLTIYRDGESEFQEISVTRSIITIPTSDARVEGDVFIISLYNFNAIAEAEMQSSLREFVRSGKTKLILDLRGNPGGFLQSAVAIGSYFLPLGKPVVREHFGDGIDEEVYRSSGRQLGKFKPERFVVLVDEGSASASEILAGALQEHDAATLIGSQTFGKGSVQELVKLDSGASLKVTIARWLTPEGVSISDGGLTPDIVIERTVEDRLNDIDPQMEEALRFLQD